jgi:MoaA/NifB/PqqE/SkfB family radical SAM enzyme
VLQIHLSRRCNLACAHCYSNSAPTASDTLDPALVSAAIGDAASLGFRTVSLSGGEPLLYEALDRVVESAEAHGLAINLVTNGFAVPSKRFSQLADKFGVIALSLDGPEARHNRVRGTARAFHRVELAARELRAAGHCFGILHTLTRESLPDLEETVAIAADWGAAIVQIHPFERAGRGLDAAGMTTLGPEERLDALLLSALLADQFPLLRIHLDLVHRDVARRAPETIHGAPLRRPQLPRELVVQEDGSVVPLTYGLDRAWQVTNLNSLSLRAAWPGFIEHSWPQLRRRLRAACIAVARGVHGEVASWHETLRQSCLPAA